MVHGKFSGSPHLVAPVATKSCGTFLAFMYFWIAELDWVPSDWKMSSTSSLSTSLRACSTAIGGCGTAIGHDIADPDLGIACARIVPLLRIRRVRADGCCSGKRREGNKASDTSRHRFSPAWQIVLIKCRKSSARLQASAYSAARNGIVARRQL